jgi:hypothetical protein
MPFEPELLRFIIGFLIARFNFLKGCFLPGNTRICESLNNKIILND